MPVADRSSRVRIRNELVALVRRFAQYSSLVDGIACASYKKAQPARVREGPRWRPGSDQVCAIGETTQEGRGAAR